MPTSYDTDEILVADLRDGDVFTLDEGDTWHTCAVVLFGNVAVYVGERRGESAPTVRIDAERGTPCHVLDPRPAV